MLPAQGPSLGTDSTWLKAQPTHFSCSQASVPSRSRCHAPRVLQPRPKPCLLGALSQALLQHHPTYKKDDPSLRGAVLPPGVAALTSVCYPFQ